MIKTKLILFFILVAITAIGQEIVTVEVSSDSPRVGDVFQIKCTVEDSNGFPEKMQKESFYPARYLSVDTSIHETLCKDVEILKTADRSFVIDGTRFYRKTYDVIAWDSCELSLVGFDYRIGDSVRRSQQVYINVSFYAQKDNIEIYDIKEAFSNWNSHAQKFKFATTIYLILTMMALFLIFLFIWFRYFKKDKNIETHLSIEQKTLSGIQALYADELWHKNRLQEHFVQFSFLLRDYLTLRFGVSFLEKTTLQSKILLKNLEINEGIRSQIEKLLNASDYVKFADSTISDEQIELLKSELIKIVHDTTPVIIEDK